MENYYWNESNEAISKLKNNSQSVGLEDLFALQHIMYSRTNVSTGD